MPLYDFRCPTCDKDIELLVRAGDTPACPGCGGTVLERLVSCIAPPGSSVLRSLPF